MKNDSTAQGLESFVNAQDRVYDSVRDELALGEMTTHWMWFIFPQLKALRSRPFDKALSSSISP